MGHWKSKYEGVYKHDYRLHTCTNEFCSYNLLLSGLVSRQDDTVCNNMSSTQYIFKNLTAALASACLDFFTLALQMSRSSLRFSSSRFSF